MNEVTDRRERVEFAGITYRLYERVGHAGRPALYVWGMAGPYLGSFELTPDGWLRVGGRAVPEPVPARIQAALDGIWLALRERNDR